MNELLEDPEPDLSVPLQIDFSEEMAADLGGPRKQFLTSMMNECREKMFSRNGDIAERIYYLERRHYYGCGLVIGKYG